jgi:putative phosphoribosyl transferase
MKAQRGRGLESTARFFDRIDAGARLAERLGKYHGKDVLVLGIPRGGVPVAAEVARRLGADLDVVVARKLGAPGYGELAIGAVTANGGRFLNEDIIRELRVPDDYLKAVVEREMSEARRREERFRAGRPVARMKDRTVIVVDDGLATGATMRAAVRSVRCQQPREVIVAVPVGSPEACDALRQEADEVVCLYAPAFFTAVGLHYEHFEPMDDVRVREILKEAFASASR